MQGQEFFVLGKIVLDNGSMKICFPFEFGNSEVHKIEKRPTWDASSGCLWIGETLVKRFLCPAKNQRTVLDAFQEEGWPRRIDDPLRAGGEIEPRQRVRNTVKALNRNQSGCQMIKFRSDGTGTGFIWERYHPSVSVNASTGERE